MNIVFFIVALVFSSTTVIAGNMYHHKIQNTYAKENLQPVELKTLNSSQQTKVEATESKKQETSQTSTVKKEKAVSNVSKEKQDEIQKKLDLIIIEGTVTSDFTLDQYKEVKNQVDNLAEGAVKTSFLKDIELIETAMTNMGINYN
ncbi:hypothetical protein [Vagococcus silagei]|uniref:Uncharacterized protein n=1 Tax=Vagococcus silagei TaxID=2508885 RepID=A0A4S3B6D0_9ENTE|nr:hypothetical protein [Vagococcus silagei]THB61460.1 hypothetical protein ESZ54_05280 [Vagococcus silagei]